MTIDYSNEYLFWSNTETVTHTTQAGTATNDITAFREDIDAKRAFFNGIALEGNELLWHIPVALVATVVPGDRITDSDSAVWRVNSVVKLGIGSSYIEHVCVCVKQR